MKFTLLSSAALTAALTLGADIPPSSSTLQNILANTDKSDLYHYPTDLTQGIIPKPIHSHNDYWRPIPFYTALSYGCISTEADVWLYNQTLYIGHEPSALTPLRTFASLYTTPILDTLLRQNPTSAFVASGTKNGVFDTNAAQTLYLFVDVKTDGPTTWPAVLDALDPLRTAGWLTTRDASGVVTPGPVTVVGTGNAPLGMIAGQARRDYFYDAHLDTLVAASSGSGSGSGSASATNGNINITSDVSPIASASFFAQFGPVRDTTAPFNSSQLALLRAQVGAAHARGIMVRYYELPSWPIALRDEVWRVLWDEGVDLINADDLAGAAEGF